MNKITYLAGTAALSAMMAMLCGSEAHAQAKLQKQGTATQITVGGKPMLLLCGELSYVRGRHNKRDAHMQGTRTQHGACAGTMGPHRTGGRQV